MVLKCPDNWYEASKTKGSKKGLKNAKNTLLRNFQDMTPKQTARMSVKNVLKAVFYRKKIVKNI